MKRYSIFGIFYTATNYVEATQRILENARARRSFGVSALAVHGLVTAYQEERLASLVNKIDMVVPDGQPIRWALNSFYHTNLKDRVYGPTLTLHVLEAAEAEGLSVFLFGSTKTTLDRFVNFIRTKYPNIKIAGVHVDRFRDATDAEDKSDVDKINASGAHVVLVGRGCPRQEVWVASHLGKVNAAMLAVGAAFDFHAGTVKQAPMWMQRNGLEWLYRLIQEPKRLWRRYLFTNSYFIFLFIKHKLFNGNLEEQ